MANPQVENGYTKIANEIMEALAKIRIPGQAYQVMLVILRKTYGFNKKEDIISLGQFAKAIGTQRPTVLRAIYKLLDMNLIIKKDNGTDIKYMFNKDFETWKPLSKKITTFKPTTKIKRICYVCLYDEIIERHHIISRNQGGSNKNENIINLCPNCHAKVHRGKITVNELVIQKDNIEKTII